MNDQQIEQEIQAKGSSAAAEELPDFKPTHWMPLPANHSA